MDRDPSESRKPANESTAKDGAAGDEPTLHAAFLNRSWPIRSVMLTGIFFMLLLYTLRIAAPLVVPIALAVLLSLLLAPLVRRLARLHILESIGAALVMLALLSMVSTAFYLLADPAQAWLARAPETLNLLEIRLSGLRESIEDVQQATERVEELTDMENDDVAERSVEVERVGILKTVLSGTTQFLASAALVFFLLYFLLAAGDGLLLKLVKLGSSLEQKKRVVGVMREIQTDISRYLVTVTIVNICLGLVTAFALFALGVPNPLLWGTMVALFNFAPYIGAAVSLMVLILVGLTSFESLGQSLLVPFTFFVLTTLEGQLITPIVLGHRLALSAVVVFLAVIICGWMWGIIGALLAVPLLASIRIVCSYFEPLQPVVELLGVDGREEA
ncbi:MAG: AI-2E family transporter [Gammaproteobacteria bacterium]|nr:AI-2E family transporter [Gammaproteobacteria bacterium]